MLRCALVKKKGWWRVEGKREGGGKELVVEGAHSDSQSTQRLRLCGEKKSLLLSVCKGNENLMRLDFFFPPSAFAAIRLSTQQQVPRGEARRTGEMVRPFLHRVR